MCVGRGEEWGETAVDGLVGCYLPPPLDTRFLALSRDEPWLRSWRKHQPCPATLSQGESRGSHAQVTHKSRGSHGLKKKKRSSEAMFRERYWLACHKRIKENGSWR